MLRKISAIDLVISCDDGTWELALVVESGEWEQHGALYALQEKLNTYSSYALDGAMSADYPESAGAKKVILIQTIDVPPEQAVQFLMKVEALLMPEGLQLKLERIGGDATDGSEGPPADSSKSSSV